MTLTDPMKAAAAYAAGGVILALAAWVIALKLETASLKVQVANLNTGVTTAKAANDSQASALAAMGHQLDVWQGNAKAATVDANKAAAAQALAQAERARALAALARREAADKALPACTAFLSVDLAKVCPATAAAMQERAR